MFGCRSATALLTVRTLLSRASQTTINFLCDSPGRVNMVKHVTDGSVSEVCDFAGPAVHAISLSGVHRLCEQ